jgi:amphi-Trp domain-containing protein
MNNNKNPHLRELLLSVFSNNRKRNHREYHLGSQLSRAIGRLFIERLQDRVCSDLAIIKGKLDGYPEGQFITTQPYARLSAGSNRELVKEERTMANEVNFEANLELQKVTSYLDEMVSSLKDGKVVVEKAHDYVVLEPVHQVQMELDATTREEREEITVKLSWEKPIEYDLKISSVEPVSEKNEEEGAGSGEREEGII